MQPRLGTSQLWPKLRLPRQGTQEKDGNTSKVLEMEEQKGSTCREAGKEMTFLGKKDTKPNHCSVISVDSIFVIPSPILFPKRQKDFSTPNSASNEEDPAPAGLMTKPQTWCLQGWG